MKKEIKNLVICLFGLLFISGLFNNSYFYLFIMIIMIVVSIKFLKKYNNKSISNIHVTNSEDASSTLSPTGTDNFYYEAKPFLTPNEYVFYHKLIKINPEWIIIPQVPLSAIVKKVDVNGTYQNELYRIIDFCVFDKNFNLLLAIELNDSSHRQIKRRERDLKVRKILNDCYIKIINFYTDLPNDQIYISNRINKVINNEEYISN